MKIGRSPFLVLGTIALTLVITFVALNFATGEKKINFDTRSFQLNAEANLNIYAADFARRQIEVFNADLAHSRRISFEEWQQRPMAEKLVKHAASLIGGQL